MAAKGQSSAQRLLERRADDVLKMHRQGRSVYFIADYLGIHAPAVRRFLQARGVEVGTARGGSDGSKGPQQFVVIRDPVRPPPVPAREFTALMLRWKRVA